MSRYLVGVDLGGTNVRAALATVASEHVAEAAAPVIQGSSDGVVGQVVALTNELARSARIGWSDIAGVAVGVPGVVPAEGGGLGLAPNLPSLARLDLRAELAGELGVDVVLDNDVNLATLAEQRYGLGAGLSDFVFISVGTGIGMGVVAGDAVRRGANGAAGEIGFLPLAGDPFDPANHVHGPLEEVAGGVGIAHRYAQRAGDDRVSAREVHARAAAGDAVAVSVLDEQARAMALAVVSVQSVLDPALAIFGGGIGSRPDFVERVRAYLPRLTRRPLRVEASVLGERAGLIGATAMARDHVLKAVAGPVLGAGG